MLPATNDLEGVMGMGAAMDIISELANRGLFLEES